MKTETFGWQTPNKICNGITDFGLLREKSSLASGESKPNVSSIYISRAVIVIGVIAAITFLICLVLADKYQKSVTLSHHYASYVHEQERGKPYRRLNNTSTYSDDYIHEDHDCDNNHNQDTQQNELNPAAYSKIQNISNNLPQVSVQEINLLLPVTTVLHSLNISRNASQSLRDNFKRVVNNFSRSEYYGNPATVGATIIKKNISSLADLLKRTELKPNISLQRDDANATTTDYNNTVTESTIHFAQLESYGIRRNAKNLQDIVKYIRCTSSSNCVFKYESAMATGTSNTATTARFQTRTNHDEAVGLQGTDSLSSSITSVLGNNDDMLHSDTNAAPYYYLPSFSADHRTRNSGFDPFRKYRVFSPQDINQLELDETENTAFVTEQTVHRFSNRMYHSRVPNIENIDDIRTQTLEPFLKPPTLPPPTTLSFTPSYTTAVFHGFDHDHFNSNDNDLKSESTADEPVITHIKPISLVVEIFPANDYELPASLFSSGSHLQQFPHHEPTIGDMNQVGNPPSIPWKQPLISQNRMRLLVNLFPQQQYKG